VAKFILTSDGRLINADLIAHASIGHGSTDDTLSIWFVNDTGGKEGMFLEGHPAQEVLLALTEHFEVISFEGEKDAEDDSDGDHKKGGHCPPQRLRGLRENRNGEDENGGGQCPPHIE
jgi:hypothetical protein